MFLRAMEDDKRISECRTKRNCTSGEIFYHMAVCVKNNILIFGGRDLDQIRFSCHVIWMFNIYTEQWSKHVIPESEPAPHHSESACAVAISDDVYVFGGLNSWSFTRTNALWPLKRTPETSYVWSEVPTVDKMKAPSPRACHRGWNMLETYGCLVAMDHHQLDILMTVENFML